MSDPLKSYLNQRDKLLELEEQYRRLRTDLDDQTQVLRKNALEACGDSMEKLKQLYEKDKEYLYRIHDDQQKYRRNIEQSLGFLENRYVKSLSDPDELVAVYMEQNKYKNRLDRDFKESKDMISLKMTRMQPKVTDIVNNQENQVYAFGTKDVRKYESDRIAMTSRTTTQRMTRDVMEDRVLDFFKKNVTGMSDKELLETIRDERKLYFFLRQMTVYAYDTLQKFETKKLSIYKPRKHRKFRAPRQYIFSYDM